MGIDNFPIVYYNNGIGNIGVPENGGIMISFTSLQSIFKEYLKSDANNFKQFIQDKNYATLDGNQYNLVEENVASLITLDQIDYSNVDIKKLIECVSFLAEVEDQLDQKERNAATKFVKNTIEIAFTKHEKLGDSKFVADLFENFNIYEALRSEQNGKKTKIKLRKQHPKANKAEKVGKAVGAGATAAGVGGAIIGAALSNGTALSAIPGLSANIAINIGLGAVWGVVAAAALGIVYYTGKHIITTAVNKAKFKGKKSLDLVLESNQDIANMENVPSLDFLKLFAEKAADIIDYKPSKFNLPGKVVKYFKIKANRNRLHTIEKHFKKDIVVEIEKTLALLKNDSTNPELINRLARLQSYVGYINSVLDDVAMEDYRDLLSGDSKTRNSTYMDIILRADKKQNTINNEGRIISTKKFDRVATQEEKDAKNVKNIPYNAKKPKELQKASALYGTSLLVKALSTDNNGKSIIKAKLEQNEANRQQKQAERQKRLDEKQVKKDNKHADKQSAKNEKIDEKIKKLNDEINELTEKFNEEKKNLENRAIGTPEYSESVVSIEQLTDKINKKNAKKLQLESLKAKQSTEKVEEKPATEVKAEPKVEEKQETEVKTEPSTEEKPAQSVQTRNIKDFSTDDLLKIKSQLEIDAKNGSLSKSRQKLYDLTIAELNEREKAAEKDNTEKGSENQESKKLTVKVGEKMAEEKQTEENNKQAEIKAKQDELFVRYEDEKEPDQDKKLEANEIAAKIKELQDQRKSVNAARKNAAVNLEEAKLIFERYKKSYESAIDEKQKESEIKKLEKKCAAAKVTFEERQKEYTNLDIEYENLSAEIKKLQDSKKSLGL